METNIKDWSYNDFLTLIYIQAASADFIISEREHDSIIAKVGEDRYKRTLKKFIFLSDYEVVLLMQTLAQTFLSSEDQKQMLIEDIQQIIHSDGQKNEFEENMLLMLKKIL